MYCFVQIPCTFDFIKYTGTVINLQQVTKFCTDFGLVPFLISTKRVSNLFRLCAVGGNFMKFSQFKAFVWVFFQSF